MKDDKECVPIGPMTHREFQDCLQSGGSQMDGTSSLNPWTRICYSFAEACNDLLGVFAKEFAKFPGIDLESKGLLNIFSMSMGIGIMVAAILVFVQVGRSAVTNKGGPLAEAMSGLGKATLAMMLTLTIASAALVASDELTKWIVKESFGSAKKLTKRLSELLLVQSSVSPGVLLIIALIGIVLVIVLWFEMLLRNAAIAVLIGASPIAAAGMVSGSTKQWWSKLVSASIQLVLVKPVIALVFAVGFSIAGESKNLTGLMSGLLVLLLAAISWPVIARFFTFANASGTGGGAGGVLGFASNQVTKKGIAGVSPGRFGRSAETRTMQTAASKASAAGGAKAASAAGGPATMAVVAGLEAAKKGANALSRRMENMAAHAGLDGANANAAPAGHPHAESTAARAALASASSTGTTSPSKFAAGPLRSPGPTFAPAITPGPRPPTSTTNPPSTAATPPPPPVSAVTDLRKTRRND